VRLRHARAFLFKDEVGDNDFLRLRPGPAPATVRIAVPETRTEPEKPHPARLIKRAKEDLTQAHNPLRIQASGEDVRQRALADPIGPSLQC